MIYVKNSQAFLFLLLLIILPLSQAHAELVIDLNRGRVEPLPIAIAPFSSEVSDGQQLAAEVPGVIEANLGRSGLFKPMSQSSFIQSAQSLYAEGPRFQEWRTIGAQALVTGVVKPSSERGKLRVEFRLFDVFSERQLAGTALTTEAKNWRRMAHLISDEIYSRLTGESGYFDTRIVYVAESGPVTKRVKRLAIMDQDGANHKFLTDGRYLVLTPRFSPNMQKITYLSYENNKPRVYIYDLNTGRREMLGDFPGMTFAPRFSPDGQKVIMSYSRDGNSDIYVMDLRTRQPKRLTNHYGIDTSPSYSPDGSQVVFESDRGGSQQLYVMDSNGINAPQRITFGDGRYGNPVWSPRGDLIAFTRIYKGNFYVGVVRPDGSGERLISQAYHVEGPSWSPNGRVLIYFKEARGPRGTTSKVYTIDLTGYNEQVVGTPQGASDPSWSPLNTEG